MSHLSNLTSKVTEDRNGKQESCQNKASSKNQIGFQFRNLGFIYLFVFLFAADLTAQSDSSSNLVKFTSRFKFKDGFYLNFEQVRNNKPIPKSWVISPIDYNSKNFFEQMIDSKSIKYVDEFGKNKEVDVSKLWGYCNDGVLHIKIFNDFNKVIIMGNISHFSANIPTLTYNRNASNNIPYARWRGGYIYSYGPPSYPTYEMKQFLLDFNTGKLLEYKTNNVEMLLKGDSELYDEFARLKARQKQQRKFMYIRKFNERNPLYLSEN